MTRVQIVSSQSKLIRIVAMELKCHQKLPLAATGADTVLLYSYYDRLISHKVGTSKALLVITVDHITTTEGV